MKNTIIFGSGLLFGVSTALFMLTQGENKPVKIETQKAFKQAAGISAAAGLVALTALLIIK